MCYYINLKLFILREILLKAKPDVRFLLDDDGLLLWFLLDDDDDDDDGLLLWSWK